MKSFLRFKQFASEKIESFRQRIALHPKVVGWRLQLFGYSPFLSNHSIRIIGCLGIALVVFGFFYTISWRSPRHFPIDALVTVERGEGLSKIADTFEEKGVIGSSFWLKVFVVLQGGEKRVVAGDYYFPAPVSVFRVANMLHRGEFGLIARRVTIPEGSSSFDIALILKKELPMFDGKGFIDKVLDSHQEGYLFPDTYFLMPNTKPDDLILMMRENFARQIQPYEPAIAKFQKPLEEVVVMASIIEGESGKSLETRRIIYGILWRRLRNKMHLQVDAPFKYYNGKHSYTLTTDDLKEDHEYNTYVNKGLPPTAIGNPGIDSIRAAITPTQTNYLYFMSDKSGNTYYAKDFEGHKRNREMHL